MLAWIVRAVPVSAIPDPTLKWKTIKTAHFEVHFHEGEEWTAGQVARIAEDIRPQINGLYDYDPGLVHFVILDTDDYANGAAYYYDNKIEIWATNLEFGLRGTTQWLWNVVTHEYTHVVSIQSAMKLPRRIPALYLQWINFENEKRPDVLTGYPNAIASYPIVGAVVPPWWAEGIAQYQSPTKRFDCWDAHRDMILRSAVLDHRMMTYDAMGFLGHRGIGNEKVYDHGYGLVRYIGRTYGPKAIERISRKLGGLGRMTIDGALKAVTGKDGRALYADWKKYLKQRYTEQLAPVYADRREGTVFNNDGFMTISPSFSPDGSRVSFLSNKGQDFAITALYLANADGSDVKLIKGATSRAAFSPDGKTLVFGRHVRINKYGAKVSDLFAWDIAKKKETRLTHGARAAHADISPDGTRVVCVLNRDGTHRLAIVPIGGGEPRVIFEAGNGAQFYSPQYSPDGTRILFGVFTKGTRDIATIASDGGDFRYLVRTPNDERDASWAPDGRSIVFASERTGIYNLYRYALDDSEVTQLTNTTGGAFTPVESPKDGTILYSSYGSGGYSVARLSADARPVATMPLFTYGQRAAGRFDDCRGLREQTATISVKAPGVGYASAEGAARPGPGAFAVAAANVAGPKSVGTGNANALTKGDDTPPTPGTSGVRVSGAVRANADRARGAARVPGGESGGSGGTDTGVPGTSEATPYTREYTAWQIFPRLVLWDNTLRFGAFLASNEMLDRQSFFFSGSYGTDGGFDATINLEMRQFFPVFYMNFYRFREKSNDRLTIPVKGIPLPYFLALRYDLWSADLGVRLEFEDQFNPTHRNDVSVWYSHSEYSVHIDPEFIDTDGVRKPDQQVGWKYFIGNEFNLRWNFKAITPRLDSDVNPRRGRELTFHFMYGVDDLFTSGEFEYGFRPRFDTNRFGQYTLDWHEYLPLPFDRHTLVLRGKASYIDHVVDDFFWVYMGGMDGIRGYTYYTLGGRAGALGSATWRFPIKRRINRQIAWLTLKDIYGGIFFEAANAWPNAKVGVNDFKRSVGGELRLNMGSFYAYPTTVMFSAAYALDSAEFRNPLFPDNTVLNDPQWRYYFTMGFTF